MKTVPALWPVARRTAAILATVHPIPNVPSSITFPDVLARLVTEENPTRPEDVSYQVFCLIEKVHLGKTLNYWNYRRASGG
jgi:hypothetical protein